MCQKLSDLVEGTYILCEVNARNEYNILSFTSGCYNTACTIRACFVIISYPLLLTYLCSSIQLSNLSLIHTLYVVRTFVFKFGWVSLCFMSRSHINFDGNLGNGRISLRMNIKESLMHQPDIYILAFYVAYLFMAMAELFYDTVLEGKWHFQ